MLAQAASVASRYARSAPMAWVLRARGAPAARLIAASRSGLGVRRSALSGVRPSACCTPLHRRPVERLQRLLMVLSSSRSCTASSRATSTPAAPSWQREQTERILRAWSTDSEELSL